MCEGRKEVQFGWDRVPAPAHSRYREYIKVVGAIRARERRIAIIEAAPGAGASERRRRVAQPKCLSPFSNAHTAAYSEGILLGGIKGEGKEKVSLEAKKKIASS